MTFLLKTQSINQFYSHHVPNNFLGELLWINNLNFLFILSFVLYPPVVLHSESCTCQTSLIYFIVFYTYPIICRKMYKTETWSLKLFNIIFDLHILSFKYPMPEVRKNCTYLLTNWHFYETHLLLLNT